jgi:DNA-binding transcriptional regulator YdaS (Cro superfamily)
MAHHPCQDHADGILGLSTNCLHVMVASGIVLSAANAGAIARAIEVTTTPMRFIAISAQNQTKRLYTLDAGRPTAPLTP